MTTPTNDNNGWIAVTPQTYPPKNKGVLVFIPDEDFHITSGMWDVSNKWVLLDEYREPECEVTHWRELPEIPEPYRTKQIEHWKLMNKIKGVL